MHSRDETPPMGSKIDKPGEDAPGPGCGLAGLLSAESEWMGTDLADGRLIPTW